MGIFEKLKKFIKKDLNSSKKGYQVANYMQLLDENPKMNFQMNFFRNDILDLQICRQKTIHKQIDFNIINEEDYASELCFLKIDEKSKVALQNFKQSAIFNQSKLSYSSNNENYLRYMFFIKQDNLILFNHIKFVIEEIYCYDKDTEYSINFHKID